MTIGLMLWRWPIVCLIVLMPIDWLLGCLIVPCLIAPKCFIWQGGNCLFVFGVVRGPVLMLSFSVDLEGLRAPPMPVDRTHMHGTQRGHCHLKVSELEHAHTIDRISIKHVLHTKMCNTRHVAMAGSWLSGRNMVVWIAFFTKNTWIFKQHQ